MMRLYGCLFISSIIHFFIIFPWSGIKKNEIKEPVLFVRAKVVSTIDDRQPKKSEIKSDPLGLIKKANNNIKHWIQLPKRFTSIKQLNNKQEKSDVLNNVENEKQMTHRLLLKVLHDQIAKKQVYPDSALELNQSGTVTIRFILSPDGFIHNVFLVKSSSVRSLDLAALNAVQAISPLKNISDILVKDEEFSIDVVYR